MSGLKEIKYGALILAITFSTTGLNAKTCGSWMGIKVCSGGGDVARAFCLDKIDELKRAQARAKEAQTQANETANQIKSSIRSEQEAATQLQENRSSLQAKRQRLHAQVLSTMPTSEAVVTEVAEIEQLQTEAEQVLALFEQEVAILIEKRFNNDSRTASFSGRDQLTRLQDLDAEVRSWVQIAQEDSLGLHQNLLSFEGALR